MPTETPTPTPTPSSAQAAENFISRIHVNGWVLLGAIVVANVLGILAHV